MLGASGRASCGVGLELESVERGLVVSVAVVVQNLPKCGNRAVLKLGLEQYDAGEVGLWALVIDLVVLVVV